MTMVRLQRGDVLVLPDGSCFLMCHPCPTGFLCLRWNADSGTTAVRIWTLVMVDLSPEVRVVREGRVL